MWPPLPGWFLSRPPLQCRMECKDVAAETLYDVLHDIEYRKKWDTNVIETFDIGRLTVNADVGYYACEEGATGPAGGGSGVPAAPWGSVGTGCAHGAGGVTVRSPVWEGFGTRRGGEGAGINARGGVGVSPLPPRRCCPQGSAPSP